MIQHDRLGRVYIEDERDNRYPLRELIAAAPAPTVNSVSYLPRTRIDQIGPSCTGAAARYKLDGPPKATKKGPTYLEIYKGGQKYDEWAGESYDGGSGRGVLNFLRKESKQVLSFWRAWTAEEMATAMLQGFGGIMLGVWWDNNMWRPRQVSKRVYVIDAWGTRHEGGHEIYVTYYNRERGLFGFPNSWGYDWCYNGICYVTGEFMNQWLQNDGDAYIGIERGAKAPDPSVSVHYIED